MSNELIDRTTEMTRDVLLKKLCPWDRIRDCCNPDANFYCNDCEPVMNEWLDQYDKQIRTEAIDDFVKEVKKLIVDLSVIRFKDIDEIAEQLKAGVKNE